MVTNRLLTDWAALSAGLISKFAACKSLAPLGIQTLRALKTFAIRFRRLDMILVITGCGPLNFSSNYFDQNWIHLAGSLGAAQIFRSRSTGIAEKGAIQLLPIASGRRSPSLSIIDHISFWQKFFGSLFLLCAPRVESVPCQRYSCEGKLVLAWFHNCLLFASSKELPLSSNPSNYSQIVKDLN